MNILENIYSRRNIKKFKPDMVNVDQINKWLEAGTMAPNHKMTQPWEVYMIGQETRTKLNHKTDFCQAPVVLAILSKHGSTEVETYENALATACFVQNMNLAAWAEGVGTFWSSMGYAAKNREIMGIPEGYDVIGVFGIGYPEEISQPKERTSIQEKITNLP